MLDQKLDHLSLIAGGVIGKKVLVPRSIDNPKLFRLHGRAKQLLGFAQRCMLIARSGRNENRRTNVGDVPYGFEVLRADVQTQWYLHEQQGSQ